MNAGRRAVKMTIAGMWACLAWSLAGCGGGDPEQPWYNQVAQQSGALGADGYDDAYGYYDPDIFLYYPPPPTFGGYGFDPDAFYPSPDSFTYVTCTDAGCICYGSGCVAVCPGPGCPPAPFGPGFDALGGFSDTGPTAPCIGLACPPCVGEACPPPANPKEMLRGQVATLLAQASDCPLDNAAFNALHGTAWCDPTPTTPRGELAALCARCCSSACTELGKQLQMQDPASAMLVFTQGCTHDGSRGGVANCALVAATIIDAAGIVRPTTGGSADP